MAGPQDGIVYLLAIDPSDTTADVDVTEFVQSFTMRKGRDRETDLYQPATATLTLLDPDRRFDPNNEDGPYSPASRVVVDYGGLVPMRRLTVRLDLANVENYLLVASDGSGAQTPDSVALSITGDIDVRWIGTLDDWSSGAAQTLISKWDALTPSKSWLMWSTATGSIEVLISVAGVDYTSSAFAVPFANGEYGGIRFTRVQATGVTTVYFSTDEGASWTSAGSSVLAAGSAMTDSTAEISLGGHTAGLGGTADGKVLSAEVRSGVAGTVVASPDFTTLVAGRNLFYEPLTDAEGNVWTGRGVLGIGAGSRLFTGFVTDWAVDYHDGDRMARVTVTATDGLGVLANSELDEIAPAHSGDKSGVRIQRVLDRAEVEYSDPASISPGISTLGPTTFGTNTLEYLEQCVRAEGGYLFVDRNGTLQFLSRHSVLNDSTTVLDFTDAHVGTGILYKQLSQSSSADLLYNRITGSGTSGNTDVASNQPSRDAFKTRTLRLGSLLLLNDAEVTSLLEWYLYRFKDPEARFSSIELNTMSLPDADVQDVALLDLVTLVTVERVPMGDIPVFRYLDLPGIASNYVSAPDAGDLDITGNICIVARVAADDWTPAAAQTIISKWSNTGNQRSYRIDLNTAGTLSVFWSTTGADNPSATSTVALAATAGVDDGDWLWVGLSFDIDEAGSRVIRFWYSLDETNDVSAVEWTELGATGGGAATSIFASTATVNLSGHTVSTVQPFAGLIGYASIRAGVGSGTTIGGTERLTFDGAVDLESFLPGSTTFTATTGETLTLNGTAMVGDQAPDTITRTCIVDGIEHTITPGSWGTVVRLGNADTRPFLVLNHPTLGRLNHNRLAF
jgi:hypothetical protein